MFLPSCLSVLFLRVCGLLVFPFLLRALGGLCCFTGLDRGYRFFDVLCRLRFLCLFAWGQGAPEELYCLLKLGKVKIVGALCRQHFFDV